MNDRNLEKAEQLLIKRLKIYPDMYTVYNDMYIFHDSNKQNFSPLYCVNLKNNKVGPFSLAFVVDDISKILKSMQKIND